MAGGTGGREGWRPCGCGLGRRGQWLGEAGCWAAGNVSYFMNDFLDRRDG